MPDRAVDTYGMLDGPTPTEDDMRDPMFLAVWEAIKHWDLSRKPRQPHRLYAGATGSDAMVILNAVRNVMPDRALVAIGDDRQWLVVLEDGDWRVRKRSNDEFCLLDEPGGGWVIDIGQSADEVLAAWLEGRSEGQ